MFHIYISTTVLIYFTISNMVGWSNVFRRFCIYYMIIIVYIIYIRYYCFNIYVYHIDLP